MTSLRPTLSRLVCLLAVGTALAGSSALAQEAPKQDAVAAETPRFIIGGDAKLAWTYEDNLDLSTTSNSRDLAPSVDAKLNLTANLTDSLTGFLEVRGLRNWGDASVPDDTGEESTANSFVELRQYWLNFDITPGQPALFTKIGRQRFREDRSIWWNSDLDAARLGYESTLFSGFVAVGEDLASYRSNTNSDFSEADEQRLRVFGEGEWQWTPDHFASLRVLNESDHSGLEDTGRVVRALDYDRQDDHLTWFGARADGTCSLSEASAISAVRYAVDVMGVGGEETLLTTTAGPGDTWRTVTGSNKRDVFGWAFDGSVNFDTTLPLTPTFMLGYAYASGDDGNGTDSAFRQTGMDGNSSRLNPALGSSARNYGEVLNPELSNLHILTAGATVPMLTASDISLIYHAYYLDEEATGLRSSKISANTNGTDAFIGQGIDLVSNLKLADEFGYERAPFSNSSMRFVVGAFDAGDAFGSNDDETAWRGAVEFRVKF